MNRRLPALAILVLLALAGCRPFPENPPAERNGRRFGIVTGPFRHRWWNYYERGRSFAEGDFHDRAEVDFREAIRQNPADRRRVPTYGRHLADYFPRRELGISLYRQGRFSEAVRELEQSLSTETSARAQFYLDRARKGWIQSEHRDRRAPEIRVAAPVPGQITDALKLTVSGTATDDTYIAGVSVNGRPIRMDVSMARFDFSAEIPLVPGENPIRIEATDLAGRVGVWEGTVRCDRTGPEVAVRRIDGRLRGYVRDASGIESVTVNGRTISMATARGTGVLIDHPIRGPAILEAADMAGNRTTVAFDSDEAPDPAGIRGFAERGTRDGVPTTERLGRYFALIAGIDAYSPPWERLRTARADAEALAALLKREYGFSDIVLLLDRAATGARILSEIRRLAHCLGESDNLLIYFAGHGELDDFSGDGYWVPVDGGADSAGWITNSAVRAILGSPFSRAKNVLVVADSCYSGSLLQPSPGGAFPEPPRPIGPERGGRSAGNFSPGISPDALPLLSGLRQSRQIIASGGLTPVGDQGGGGHSPFARVLLDALGTLRENAIDAETLAKVHLWPAMAHTGQRPQYGRMAVGADAEGQFVFLRQGPRSESAPSCDADALAFPDAEPPRLSVDFPGKTHRTFLDRVVLSIFAEDENGIQWIAVDAGRPGGRDSILERPARREIQISHIVPLAPGENFIRVRCADQLGNVREETRLVVREIPAILAPDRRMPLARASFDAAGDALETRAEDRVREHLSALDRFALHWPPEGTIPTPRFQLDGTVLASEKEGSPRKRIEIKAEIRAPDFGGDPIHTLDVYGEGDSVAELAEKMAEELALKIADAFPRIRGEITRIDLDPRPGWAVLDRGAENRLFPGLRVLFFEDVPAPAPPGQVREICEGRILETKERSAYAPPDPPTEISRLRPEMGFIVR